MRRFTLEDHAAATAGVECRKDAGVIDETPMAYKDIDGAVAEAHWWGGVQPPQERVCAKGGTTQGGEGPGNPRRDGTRKEETWFPLVLFAVRRLEGKDGWT